MRICFLIIVLLSFIACKESQFAIHVDNKFKDTIPLEKPVDTFNKSTNYVQSTFVECGGDQRYLRAITVKQSLKSFVRDGLIELTKVQGKMTKAFAINAMKNKLKDQVVIDMLRQGINLTEQREDQLIEKYIFSLIYMSENNWDTQIMISGNGPTMLFNLEGTAIYTSRCIENEAELKEEQRLNLICANSTDVLKIKEDNDGRVEVSYNNLKIIKDEDIEDFEIEVEGDNHKLIFDVGVGLGDLKAWHKLLKLTYSSKTGKMTEELELTSTRASKLNFKSDLSCFSNISLDKL